MCTRRRLLVRPFALLAVALVIAGCSSLPRTSYTASDAASSTVLDVSELRRYADEPAAAFLKTEASSRARTLSYLALSGGGADGAYGAGVLNGWSAAGTRPEFSVVSGVSTGALIAPFAFLGPAYDATLRHANDATRSRHRNGKSRSGRHGSSEQFNKGRTMGGVDTIGFFRRALSVLLHRPLRPF